MTVSPTDKVPRSEAEGLPRVASRVSVPRVLSLGGGLDSFAVLVESIRRRQAPDVVCFVDVADGTLERDGQDPGEWPGTYRHVREVVAPLCAREGIELVWLDSERYPVRDARSLYEWLRVRHQIPVSGPNRLCTQIAKVNRFEAWCTDRWPGQEVEVWIGFEAGEEKRVEKDPNAGGRRKVKPGDAVRRNRFPLIEWRICRCRAEALVRAAGFAVPRKSSCTMCPYATRGDFQVLARERPEEFAKIAALEADKPVTKNGAKLSIKDFRTVKLADGTKRYKTKLLPELVKGVYRPKVTPCAVCGAPQRATKAAGCDWLPGADEEEAAE